MSYLKISESNNEIDLIYRRMHRVFQMVHELHKIGYQGLRIQTQFYMSYRIIITPAVLSRNQKEVHLPVGSTLTVNGDRPPLQAGANGLANGSGEVNYFGWKDVEDLNARQLGNRFLVDFPLIAQLSLIDDPVYSGWLSRLIGEMEQGWYPVWIHHLGLIRLKPSSDRTRALERELAGVDITESKKAEIDRGTGYSEPLDDYKIRGLMDSGLWGRQVEIRYLSSDGEGDSQQQGSGVSLVFPSPPTVDVGDAILDLITDAFYRFYQGINLDT